MTDDAFTSGSVSSFAGATGLRKALLDWCVGGVNTDEALSGSGTSWSGTLSNTPVSPGSLFVDYTIGGTPYEATDDGVGNLSGTNLTTGTINYSTGAYDLTFAASATGVTADYIDGEPGQDWEVLMEQDTNDDGAVNPFVGSNHKEVILRNRGLSGLEQVLVGLREWEYPGGNAYGWNLNVYTFFTDAMAWNANKTEHGRTLYNTTWNTFTNMPNLPLVDDTIYYWFFSNRQRIVVVAKVQSNYEAAYLGFGLRYSAPERYPFPLVCKGSNYGITNYSAQSDMRTGLARNYWGTTGYPLIVVNPGSEYINSHSTILYLQGCKMLPMSPWTTADGVIIAAPVSSRVWARPITIAHPAVGSVYMDLDGCVALVGTGVQAEDIIKDKENGRKYIAFPDVYRSGSDDHYAVLSDGEWTTTTSTTTSTTSTTSTTTTTV